MRCGFDHCNRPLQVGTCRPLECSIGHAQIEQGASPAFRLFANLKCDFELTGAVSVRGDAPARMKESKAALATGKQPTRLGLLLASRLGEWALTLDGPTLGVFGLQIPAGDDDDADKTQILESRCESVSDLCGSLDLLFQRFLRLRLSKEWDAVHTRIAMWIAQFDPRDARDEQRLASVG